MSNEATAESMQAILQRQKACNISEGAPSVDERIEWIDRSIALLLKYGDRFNDAMCDDFGHRSKDQSNFTDIASSIGTLKHAKKHVAKWVKPSKRKPEFPLGLLGAKAEVQYQPKGVVGVISPWNFPVNLTFTPLAGIFAAGNRCMIKPSEFTEATSEVMREAFAEFYSEDEVAVCTGGPEIGAAFSGLAFDHLLFTGATSIAHHVMRAAAENLVPLTLELGGKSPVILGRSADMEKAAARIMAGKTLNAGQICLAPDYAFVPEESTQEFVAAAGAAVDKMFPSGLKDNDDYTSVVNQRHYDRIMGYIDEARESGAEVIELNPTGDDFTQQPHHKIAPHIIVDPSDELSVMKDEIFGPILPIKSYQNTEDAVAYVNEHERPLGLYYFGEDKTEQSMVLNSTTSGGATVNDVIFHVAQEELPFGGVGPSGMGSYHGHDGFLEFSHKKSVFVQTGMDVLAMLRPPYGATYRKQVKNRLKV